MMLNMNQTETVVNATTANTTGPWAQRFLQFQDSPKIWETLSAAAFSVVDFLRHGSELAAGSAPCIPWPPNTAHTVGLGFREFILPR